MSTLKRALWAFIVAGLFQAISSTAPITAARAQAMPAGAGVVIQPPLPSVDELRTKFGAKGDGVTDDAVPLQNFLNDCTGPYLTNAVAGGKIIRAGTYLTSQPLVAKCEFRMEPGSLIRATADMTAVVATDPVTRLFNAKFIGLDLDANDHADAGLWIRSYSQGIAQNLTVRNVKLYGIRVGDPASAGSFSGSDFGIFNFTSFRNQNTIPSGSGCIFIEANSRDTIVDGGTPRDCDKAVITYQSHDQYLNLHAWSNPTYGVMTIGVEDHGSGNRYKGDQWDTATVYGMDMYGFNPTIEGNYFYNSPNVPGGVASDNVVIGIHFRQPSGIGATIAGNYFYGSSVTGRFAKDHDIGSPTGNNIYGNSNTNVVTINSAVFIVSDVTTNRSLSYFNGTLTINNNSSGGGISYVQGANGLNLLAKTLVNGAISTSSGSGFVTGVAGEIGLGSITPSGTAPGGGFGKISIGAGTLANSGKLISYFGNLTVPTVLKDNIGVTPFQYASPTTGQTVTADGHAYILLSPAGAIAALTIALYATPYDGMFVTVSSSQAITTLALTGGTVVGTPTLSAAGSTFKLIWSAADSKWWLVA